MRDSLQPGQTKRVKGLTRQLIVAAAIEMLDAEGLDAFSLRGLASRLNVHVSSFYEYFPGKNELLGAVFHSINDGLEHEIDESSGWQQHLRTSMRSFRQMLIQHPYLPLISRFAVVEVTVNHVEVELAALARGGFSPEEAAHAFSSARTFVIGSAMSEFKPSDRPEGKFDPSSAESQALFPHLSDSIEFIRDSATTFEYGLECLIRGIEARAASRPT